MVFWENQIWETGGGGNRLTIKRDGTSKVEVFPPEHYLWEYQEMNPRPGWEKIERNDWPLFLMRNVFDKKTAIDKFNNAFKYGIHKLRGHKPEYLDGSGVLIGYTINGKLQTVVIPKFNEKQRNTYNYKRFENVSNVLSDFDTNVLDAK